MEVPLDRDVDQFLFFDLVLNKRGRTWRWSVCTTEGTVVMVGSESSRPAAKYQADRALFLVLLSAPYRSIRLGNRSQGLGTPANLVGDGWAVKAALTNPAVVPARPKGR